jgi:hypothetical protein
LSSFENIPHEMRQFRQWLVWRYEDRQGTKPTKVPYCAHNGMLGSSTDSLTWSTFDEAVAASGRYDGIGFVLTEDDPYCFIDLDDPYEKNKEGGFKYNNPQEVLDRQLHVFNTFNSYAEKSPSGKGLHIIVRAKVPNGRKRAAIEVYSNERYMTMTGDTYRAESINDCNEAVNLLWMQMGGASTTDFEGWPEARESDYEVYTRACSAANGQKFKDLHEGRWQDHYPSQSEADLAYVDIVAFYTQNKEQIKRMFRACVLGWREKAKRADYVNYMLNKCFDRIAQGNVDGLSNITNAVMAQVRKEQAASVQEATVEKATPYTAPPGLLGKLAHFIYSASPRPVPEIALVGAIGLMAGIAGRAYNVSGLGLNQYILLLAPTGTGKEAIATGIDRIMNVIVRVVPSAADFVGPAEISSPQALTKYLNNNSRSFVSIVGEFGLMLAQLTSDHAAPHLKGLRRMFLDLFNKSGSGQQLRPTIYSDKEKNTSIIQSPAFSLLGESTPERFYEVLNEGMINEGLLPRITIVEYNGDRPGLNEGHREAQPSFELVEQLGTLAAQCLQLNSQHKVTDVKFTPEAEHLSRQFNEFCDSNINKSDREVRRHLWNRAHVKVLKLAALVAVGINPYEPTIDKVCMDWALGIVLADVRNLLGRFDAGEIGVVNDEAKQISAMTKIIFEYLNKPWDEINKYKPGPVELHANQIIPHAYVSRRGINMKEFKNDRMGATNAIKRTLGTMIERGDLQQVSKVDLQQRYGVHSTCYMVASTRIFGQAQTRKAPV